jgi:hypothetical protein
MIYIVSGVMDYDINVTLNQLSAPGKGYIGWIENDFSCRRIR